MEIQLGQVLAKYNEQISVLTQRAILAETQTEVLQGEITRLQAEQANQQQEEDTNADTPA